MNRTKGKKQSSNGIKVKSSAKRLLSENPVFVRAVAIVPILGAALTLKSGLLISAAMILTVLFLNLAMYGLNMVVPKKFIFTAAFLTAGIVVTPVCMFANYIAPTIAPLCGIYLPILSVCALPMIETRHYGAKYGILRTALDALFDGAGFAVAAVVFSVIREIIGNGTLYDRPMPGFSQFKFSFALAPAGAFILLGLVCALFRKIFGMKEDNGEGMK